MKAPRILIAEDNRVNQVVVLRVLQTLLRGCRPDVVENGLQVGRGRDGALYVLCCWGISTVKAKGCTCVAILCSCCVVCWINPDLHPFAEC